MALKIVVDPRLINHSRSQFTQDNGMWMNDTPRSSSIASDLNTLSNRSSFMYPSASPQPMHRNFNHHPQSQFNTQFSQPPPPQRPMDPRFRNMSSSVFDLNNGNMMRQPVMNNPQWMNNNMQQVRELLRKGL